MITNNKMCLIGIDAGTTGLKSLVFDLQGKVLGKAYREYPLHHPRPDWAEQNPEDWWDALAATLRELLVQGACRPADVAGVSISYQGSTFVAMGRGGQVLRPALSWLDRRANVVDEEYGINTISDDEIFNITGLRYYPGWTAPMLAWLKAHEPQTMKALEYILMVGDYLVYRMTDKVLTDYSAASRTRLFDLANKQWSSPLLDALGITPDILPPLAQSGMHVAGVSAEGARVTGLLEGTPVALGAFDQSCAALGAGAISDDTLMVSLGTATMVSISTPQAIVDPQKRVTTSCHAIPDMWTVQAPISTTGAILRWWRDDFFPCEVQGNRYDVMDRLAAQVEPGANGLVVLPHFSGSGAPNWDHSCKGGIIGLTLAQTQSHVIRAILEGVAMEIRSNYDVFASLGCDVRTVRIVGGGASSVLWRSIIADVLGKPQQQVCEVEVGTLGAAMLAGLGAGIFTSVDDAVAAMVTTGPWTACNVENHYKYQRVRDHYLEIAHRLYGHDIPENGPEMIADYDKQRNRKTVSRTSSYVVQPK